MIRSPHSSSSVRSIPATRRVATVVPLLLAGLAGAQEPAPATGFVTVRRPGAVELAQAYDLSGLSVPQDQIHTLLPKDAIPALTDPATETAAAAAEWLATDARIVVVRRGDAVLGVPTAILDRHEVVNATVGGEPIAVTWCPLCDSAAVVSRRFGDDVLEFGVSGALYNSNVLMYDRTDRGLWSQVGMRCVSGPRAGTELQTLPFEMLGFARFRERHPEAPLVSRDTGHDRDYTGSPYAAFLGSDRLMVPVAAIGDALPAKTQGIGIRAGDAAWFVPTSAIGERFVLDAGASGRIALAADPAGVRMLHAPDTGVQAVQTFYYAWSAFFAETAIAERSAPGLVAGERVPGDVELATLDGGTVRLADLYRERPVVLTFYRGAWCPYCRTALEGLEARRDDILAAGADVVAISPERPERGAKLVDRLTLGFRVLVDTEQAAARRFGVAFRLDEATQKAYAGYGVDLAASNVSGTWDLPAPATFVIGTDGVVRYAFGDWDYRRRAEPEAILAAVRAAVR